MKKLLILLTVLFAGNVLHSQYVYTIKADSVKITNHCDTAELILENHTQNIRSVPIPLASANSGNKVVTSLALSVSWEQKTVITLIYTRTTPSAVAGPATVTS